MSTASHLKQATDAIRHHKIVAYPTETFYGLAVDPFCSVALDRLIELKWRAPTKGLPLIAANLAAVVEQLGALPEPLQLLAEYFWPGPLTLAFKPAYACPPQILGQHETVAVRVSSHPVATALAAAVGGLISSTSANRSGCAPVTCAAKLEPCIVQGVACILPASLADDTKDSASAVHHRFGEMQPSTIVAWDGECLQILRQGEIAISHLEQATRYRVKIL